MKKNILIVLIIIALIIIVMGFYYYFPPNNSSNPCNELKKNLDNNIGSFNGIVGGTLMNVSSPYYYIPEDKNQSKLTYTLTFKGMEKQVELHLITSSDNPLSYEVGNFYKFDLSNIRKSGMLSGAFFDINQTELQPVNCK